MKRPTLFACTLALLGTAPVAAQSVTLRGKVEDVPGAPNQFFVNGTNTQLTSPTIDLNPFLAQQVLIGGTWNGSASAPSVSVASIAIVPRTFEVGGNGSLGGQMVFAAFGTPGSSALLAMSLQPGFLPMPGLEVVFLDLASLIVLGTGPIGAAGQFEISVPIPNDPAFLGLPVRGQGAIFGPGIATVVTNPDWKTIQS